MRQREGTSLGLRDPQASALEGLSLAQGLHAPSNIKQNEGPHRRLLIFKFYYYYLAHEGIHTTTSIPAVPVMSQKGILTLPKSRHHCPRQAPVATPCAQSPSPRVWVFTASQDRGVGQDLRSSQAGLPFTHKCLLTTHCAPGSALGAEETAGRVRSPCPVEVPAGARAQWPASGHRRRSSSLQNSDQLYGASLPGLGVVWCVCVCVRPGRSQPP